MNGNDTLVIANICLVLESEPSLGASFPSGDVSTSSGSSNSVPIDQTTLSYIQQAFKDIYSFIKSNQCYGFVLLSIYIYIIGIVIKNSDYVNRLKSLRFDIQKCIYAITEQTFTLKEGIISPLTPFVLCSL